MSTNGNYLTSPIGQIQFMAVNKPVTNKKTGKERREICLLLDTKEAKDFIAAVTKVNSGIPVTAATYRGSDENLKAELAKGKTKISAGTNFEVPVYDSKGNKLEEAPYFFKDSTGTAQMIVQPYTKSDKGGTINLVSIVLHSLEHPNSGGTSREEKLAQLQEVIKAVTKQ